MGTVLASAVGNALTVVQGVLASAWNLTVINLSENPQISGKILEQIRYPRYIKILVLNDLDITDEHIENITQFKNLGAILLNNTKITNKSASILFGILK